MSQVTHAGTGMSPNVLVFLFKIQFTINHYSPGMLVLPCIVSYIINSYVVQAFM